MHREDELEEHHRVSATGDRTTSENPDGWDGKDVYRETVCEISTTDQCWWQSKDAFKQEYGKHPTDVKTMTSAKRNFPDDNDSHTVGVLRRCEDAGPPRVERTVYQRIIIREKISGAEDTKTTTTQTNKHVLFSYMCL